MSCGADEEEFGAEIRSLCLAVEVTGCFPLELALSSERMRRAAVWAIAHLGEQEETIGECLDEVREFLRRASGDPVLEDALSVLLTRHPEFIAGSTQAAGGASSA